MGTPKEELLRVQPPRGQAVYNLHHIYHLALASAFLLLFNSRIAVLEFMHTLPPAMEPRLATGWSLNFLRRLRAGETLSL